MNHTTNYNLSQWEAEDFIRRTDFNADNAAIDTALHRLAGSVGALQSGKADAAALAAEAQSRGNTDSAHALRLTALEAGLAALGTHGHNCRLAIGSYAGNNANGSAAPSTVTLDFYPVAMLVTDTRNAANSNAPTFGLRPFAAAHSTSGATINFSWGDTSVSWYGESPAAQNNRTGDTYYYLILGYDKDAEDA